MGKYAIVLARSAEKEVLKLPVIVAARVRQVFDGLATKPRPPGCRKLKNARNRWRVRIGNYRVLYTINDAERIVDIEAVRHRREAYQ